MFVRIVSCIALALGVSATAQAAPQYDSGYYGGQQTIRCESDDGRNRHCDADTRGGVRLVRQFSKSQCIQGNSWGYDRDGVWVSNGCRAEFELGRGGGGGNWNGGGGWNGGGNNGNDSVVCESDDGRTRTCAIGGNRARLVRQMSKSPCIEGQSWGSQRGSVWVSNGCRGEFSSGRGGGNWNGGGGWNGGGNNQWRSVTCESNDGRKGRIRRCNTSIRDGARLIRQMSKGACIEGQTWGWDPNGIWVQAGCRGEFSVR